MLLSATALGARVSQAKLYTAKGVTQLLQVKDLTITHRKDLRVILENFNLVLNDGDKAVIIGEEGNGKSTLMKWIYDPALADEYTECTGSKMAAGESFGYLPQELSSADKKKSVYEYFSESGMFFDKSPRELSSMAAEFELPADFFYHEQQMSTLSGGERGSPLNHLMLITVGKSFYELAGVNGFSSSSYFLIAYLSLIV